MERIYIPRPTPVHDAQRRHDRWVCIRDICHLLIACGVLVFGLIGTACIITAIYLTF